MPESVAHHFKNSFLDISFSIRHEMKLNAKAFVDVKTGRQKYETRLFDEKRRKISVGDTIIFSKLPELNEKIADFACGTGGFLTSVLNILDDKVSLNILKSALSILESVANQPALMKDYKQDDISISQFHENLQNRIDQLEIKIRRSG